MDTNSGDNSHFGGHLLIVVSEPYTDDHKERILEKVSKGLLSWDVTKTGSDLTGLKDEFNKELNPEQPEDFIVQYSTERLAVEVLLNPKVSVFKQCLKNLLSSSTAYKHIIYAGYAFTGSGSWILRDGAFSFKAFTDIFNDPDVQCVLMKIPDCSVHIHCTAEGDWCESNITENMTCVFLNPPDITSSFPGSQELVQYLKRFLISHSLEEIMKPSAVVGNIRFSRPTLYVFPGGDGNCALFGISGFNMLVDGGFERKPCFWEFVRHIDRLDAMIITRVNESNLNGITSLIKRKQKEHVFPHVGYIFCNITDGKDSPCDEVPKDKDDLLVSILDEGHEFLNNLSNLNLKPHLCFRENGTDPLTLYHKMGHGTLDMYVLTPPKENKEVKEFFQQWSSKKDSFSSTTDSMKNFEDVSVPLSDLVSISALVVWRPANLKDPITRILITGNAPQSKIFEGLETIKDLEILQQFDCTQSVLRKTVGDKPKLIKNAEKPVAKVLPKPNTSSPSGPQKKIIQKTQTATGKKDNAVINKTTSERRPSDPTKSSTRKNIDSKKLETKVNGKSLESNKDVSKTGTPSSKGKELQSSDTKKIESAVKTVSSVERKTKGAKDINNKKTVETKISNKNAKSEPKTKRPETPTKISHVSKETSGKTPTSSPKHSTKPSTSKSVKKPQQTEMNIKKRAEHKLASARLEENSKIGGKSSLGSLDTEEKFKVGSNVTTDVQKTEQDNSSINMVANTETDIINSFEKEVSQPSNDDRGDFGNVNLISYDQSIIREAVASEAEPLDQANEKVFSQTDQLSQYVLTDRDQGITETECVLTDKDKGITETECVLTDKDQGITETECVLTDKDQGTTETECVLTDKDQGTTETECVLTDKDQGTTETECVLTDKDQGTTETECVLTDKDQGITETECVLTDKDQVKVDSEITSYSKNELEGVSLNKSEGLAQTGSFSDNTQDCFHAEHDTNDTSQVLIRTENMLKDKDNHLGVTPTRSVLSDQKLAQTEIDQDQGLNKVNGMTEIELGDQEKGKAESEFLFKTSDEKIDYTERVFRDKEEARFGSVVDNTVGSVVDNTDIGWSKMNYGITNKDKLDSIDNYVSNSKCQGLDQVEKGLSEEDSQRTRINEETEGNFDNIKSVESGRVEQSFDGGFTDNSNTRLDLSVGGESIVKNDDQIYKDVEKSICQNTVENLHAFDGGDIGISEQGRTAEEFESPGLSQQVPLFLKDQDIYKETISDDNQVLDKPELLQQDKDGFDSLNDNEVKISASTVTNEQSFDELNEKTNIEEKEQITEVKLAEETVDSESVLSISDPKFDQNEEFHAGIPFENKISEIEKRQATHFEKYENSSFTNEENLCDLQTGSFLQEQTNVAFFDNGVQERELENQLNEPELIHQTEDSSCFIAKTTSEDILDVTEQESLKRNACEQIFGIDSTGYPSVYGDSLASEEQESTFPLDNFNHNYREDNTGNLTNRTSNEQSSNDFDIIKHDSELSDYKNDHQVDFVNDDDDRRNTRDEIKESLYLDPLEKQAEETAKNTKEQEMIPQENDLDLQKNFELAKDHIHVPGSQLGVKSEPHTSEKDYSASETLDAVSDDILPEDGTPCGEAEKSFDQSFGEGFPNSSHEKNLEIKEAIDTVHNEKETIIAQSMNQDEMYFTHDDVIKLEEKQLSQHQEISDEDDGEMIRYPTPPGDQDFYEHVGPDAQLKEDHIESGSYILQYDVTGHHSQTCEDLTEQPLYEESEEDESERSGSPVIEEPVYGNTLKANYPEMVNISEGTTPSEPQSPLDAKQQVPAKTQRDHSVDHHISQEKKIEFLENMSETKLEQKESEQMSAFPHILRERDTEGNCGNLNEERDFYSQKHSKESTFECKTEDVSWDKSEQEFLGGKADCQKEGFLYEQGSDLTSLSLSHQYCEDSFGVSSTDIKHNESTFAYKELTCSDKDSFSHYSSSELLRTVPTDLARENLQATYFEDDTRDCEKADDPKTSQTEIMHDLTNKEEMGLNSSNLIEHGHLQDIDSYGSDSVPANQLFSTAAVIQDQANYEEHHLPLNIADKEPNSFITRDSTSSSSEDEDNPYYGEQASHYSYSNRSYYQEDAREISDFSSGHSYSTFPHQSQFGGIQNPTFDDQSNEYEKLQEDSATTIHTKSSGFNRSDEEFHLDNWDKPLGLPTPPDSQDITKRNKMASKTTIKGSTKTPVVAPTKSISNHNVKKGLLNGKSTPTASDRAVSPRTEKTNLQGKSKGLTANGLVNPIYVDLTYVPNHGDPNYCDVEFFRKIRARYYVFSGTNPTKEAFNALLEAKKDWNDKDAEVTIIPTHETDALGYWIALNQEILAANKIEVAPSADRCTINLQDHETSCAAYRLEF
ncbi:microtubule-associated protein futsch-like isoform X2 [Limulus polyphemus]|uniref:Microtubule-associated protein futsch-like isoform X2 n=1 Tax=Limulus polyphemus TaxID=6850 RepID=A0ABM1TEG6_LIMPO|nr:microtubule-associated protein futsch-like isoform X2 [Limulus polyphemus]